MGFVPNSTQKRPYSISLCIPDLFLLNLKPVKQHFLNFKNK